MTREKYGNVAETKSNGSAMNPVCRIGRVRSMECGVQSAGRGDFVILGNNPVCYRHRLPAIFGSVFKVLELDLAVAFCCIWLA